MDIKKLTEIVEHINTTVLKKVDMKVEITVSLDSGKYRVEQILKHKGEKDSYFYLKKGYDHAGIAFEEWANKIFQLGLQEAIMMQMKKLEHKE
jgi:hypothetical protein